MSKSFVARPNILGRVVGWAEDGATRIEVLADAQGVMRGEVYLAKVRFTPFQVKPTNFLTLKKYGLRVGGIVLVRGAKVMGDATLEVRNVETIVARETNNFPVLLDDAAVCILPPKEGTKMVDRARVIIGLKQSKTKDPISDVRLNQMITLEKACIFGWAGIVLAGEDDEGDIFETMIGGDQKREVEEVLKLFEETVPAVMVDKAIHSKYTWRVAPFFQIDIAPDRSSRLSAQRLNIDYGEGDELSWTYSNVVIRASGTQWLLCDASSGDDVVQQKAGLLLDVFEDNA